MKTYTIRLKNCAFWAHHGVFQEETTLGQAFYVDLELTVDRTDGVTTDEIENTVNYGEVFDLVEQVMKRKPLKLIEHVGHVIGTEVCDAFPLVRTAEVTVRKPAAPVAGILDHVEVIVVTEREA